MGRDGSIDWLCWPHFDSHACFAAVLGTSEDGRWQIAPKDKAAKVTRRYRPNTLILEMLFETADGAATLIDFMPPREGSSHLLRLLVGERGEVELHDELILRFGYSATVPWVTRIDDHTMRAAASLDTVVLHSSAPFRGEHFRTVGDFSINAGEKKSFGLSSALSHKELPEADTDALSWWRRPGGRSARLRKRRARLFEQCAGGINTGPRGIPRVASNGHGRVSAAQEERRPASAATATHAQFAQQAFEIRVFPAIGIISIFRV